MRKIGAHVSASGGLHRAVERAHEIGCNCAQIFSASPRIWNKPKIEAIETKLFFEKQKELSINPVVTHALYLINLSSDNPAQVEKSIKALTFELQFDALIKGAGVVVHLGSHQGKGWEAVKDQVATNISTILENTPENSTFLIENSAGQQGKLCCDLSDIRWLMDRVKSPRLQWCVDTCHLFCAGYRLSPTSKSLNDGVKTSALLQAGLHTLVVEDEIERLNLWDSLACVHVNDSRDPFGTGKDRHENLGDGMIPKEDFKHFLNLKQLKNVPMMLEVPGIDGEGPDAENVKRLKKIVEE